MHVLVGAQTGHYGTSEQELAIQVVEPRHPKAGNGAARWAWNSDCEHSSQKEPIRSKAAKAEDPSNQPLRKGSVTEELERPLARDKSRIRSGGEYVYGVIKRLWGSGKVRCRGLAKNASRSFVALGLANICPARGARDGTGRDGIIRQKEASSEPIPGETARKGLGAMKFIRNSRHALTTGLDSAFASASPLDHGIRSFVLLRPPCRCQVRSGLSAWDEPTGRSGCGSCQTSAPRRLRGSTRCR